ncbi:MAG: Ig-like domain-containing protein [Verrucomicrobiota bacterium JB023]|nr:Ig-like domain-containing protein [Verrucomicrobiota bacterium JB023]
MKPTSHHTWWLTTFSALVSTASLPALEFGNIDIVQHDNANDQTSVTATVVAGSTSGVSVVGQNRGDVDMDFGANEDDPYNGVLISSVSQNSRNNFLQGDTQDGLNYANTGSAHPNGITGGYFVPTHNMGGSAENTLGRSEYNINFAVGYFPYLDWLGGTTGVSTNGGALTEQASILSPGLSLGDEILDVATGRFTVDLTDHTSFGVPATSQNGILLTIHSKNEGNFSMAQDNEDGTFSVTVMDNGQYGGGLSLEQDPFAFVYIPTAIAGDNTVTAVGRIQSDGTAEISGGNFNITRRDAPGKEIFTGTFESNLTDADANFLSLYADVIATGAFEAELTDAEGNFDTLLTDFGTKTYFLEILDGDAEGTVVEITSATATVLTTDSAITAGTATYNILEADVSNRNYLVEILSGPDAGEKATITGISATQLTTATPIASGAVDYRIAEPASEWVLTIPGQDNTTGVLLVTPEGGYTDDEPLPNNTDNFASYEWSDTDGGWVIQSRDVEGNPDDRDPVAAQEEGITDDEDMFSFVFLTTQPSNVQPTIAITSPTPDQQIELGSSLTLRANAADAGGSVVGVDFYVNDVLVGTDTTAPYEVTVGPYNSLFNGKVEALVRDNQEGFTRSEPVYFHVVPPAGSGGLYFNGVSQYATFGNATELGLGVFTIETWFRYEGGEATTTDGVTAIPMVTKGRSEADQSPLDMNYFLGIRESDGVLVADFEDSVLGTNVPVTGRTPVTASTWQHAAVVFDGSEWALYLDGNLEATAEAGDLTPRLDSVQHAALATALDSEGEPDGFFQGMLDEVRIWDTALTQSEIRANCLSEIPSASSLVARWSLDEATGTTITSTAQGAVVGDLVLDPFRVDGVNFTGNTKPDVTLTGPEDSSVYVLDDIVQLTAVASDPDGSIAQVEFFSNGVSVGTDTTAPYTANLTIDSLGAHTITAWATDNGGASSRSTPLTLEALLAPPTIPGYTVGLIDGGSRDIDEPEYVAPGDEEFTYEIVQTTASPRSFDNPNQNVGDFGFTINGNDVAYNSGILLANNTALLTNLGPIDNNISVKEVSGNYQVSIEDNNGPGASNPSTPEESGRFSLGYFPFSDGWVGAKVLPDGSFVDGSANFPEEAPVTVTNTDSGVYEISGLPTAGNLITVGVGNGLDNVTSVGQSGANWVVQHRDNGGGLQNEDFSFLYVPKRTRQVLSGLVQNDGALVPLNEELELLGASVNLGTQGYEITFGDGSVINPSTAIMFMVGDFDNGYGGDNIYSYFGLGNTFVVFSHDLPGLTRAFQQGGFRFVVMPLDPTVLASDEVIVTATDASASEGGDTGQFTFRRFGDTSSELTVGYSVAGSATQGVDFSILDGSVTFASGEELATVTVEALNDNDIERTETVVLTLNAGSGYSIGTYNEAFLSIVNVNSTVITKTVSFQEGVADYTGQYGKAVGEDGTNTIGSEVQDYYLDGRPENGSPDVNGIVRFDNIFGNGENQIPVGSGIQDAKLIITTSTAGSAQSGGPYIVDRLTVPVDDETTYTDLQQGDLGDGFEGVRGSSTGLPVAGFGTIANGQVVSANVTALVQAWSNGAPNHGFSIFTGGTTDGWSYNTVGNDNPYLRPKLEVTYTVNDTLKDYFYYVDRNTIINNQQGSDNTGSAVLDGATVETQFLDLNDPNAGTTEALLHFPVSFGVAGDLNSIPDGESVVKAELMIGTNSARFGGSTNAQSGGPYAVHQMMVDWDLDTTFGLFGPVVPNEIGPAAGRVTGMGWASYTFIDITSVVQNWRAGDPNYGVNLKPETGDGWQPFWQGVGSISPGLVGYTPTLRVTTAILEDNSFDEYMAANGAPGANFLDDRDNDGIVALIEYGLGLDPDGFDMLPQLELNGDGNYSLTFAKGSLAAVDPRVTYAIECSEDLEEWDVLEPTVNDTSEISAVIPGGENKMFARIRVDYAQ